MRIIRPKLLEITGNDAPVSALTEFVPTTTYYAGDRVKVSGTFPAYEYEAITTTVGGNPASSANWLALGAVNNDRLWDYGSALRADFSGTDATITQVLTAADGEIDSVALFGMNGIATVHILITQGEITLYDETHSGVEQYAAPETGAPDWQYRVFGSLRYRESLIVALGQVVTPTVDTIISVTLSGSGGAAYAASALVVGYAASLGHTLYGGASIEIQDYSRRVVDDWGNVSYIKRSASQNARYRVIVDDNDAPDILRALADLRAEAIVWDGSNEAQKEELQVIGYYENGAISLETKNGTYLTLDVLGVSGDREASTPTSDPDISIVGIATARWYNGAMQTLIERGITGQAANFRVELLALGAVFTASHDTKAQVDAGGTLCVSNADWPADGVALTGVTVLPYSTDQAAIDFTDVAVPITGAQLGPAYYALIYLDVDGAGTDLRPMWWIDFGGHVTKVVSETLNIRPHSNGLITFRGV